MTMTRSGLIKCAVAVTGKFQPNRHCESGSVGAAVLTKGGNVYTGVCIDCGDDVAFARLQAYPTAKRCIVCQEKREREYAQEGRPKM